ncbi:hypothetical protein AXG93_517s1200 [Marchantia polymorpha subsp. ruderalis]|uniref:Protein kinase domain-containing protein n=1 Tax=Marchantia polymorpha subsp. ruderalis TaxID=1480154 RepID=A0A176VLG6_MARPO|nr:hypothetical protein AXG93_517s1200 [Marchantia polymorpha subsp. ruderalis]
MERAALWILAVVALASCVPRALAQDFNRDVTNLLTAKPTLSNGDNPFLQTWNATSSICSWRGTVWAYTNGTLLDCDSPEVRANQSLARDADVVVTELNLGATGLTGSIPKEFGLLGALSVLWLRENVLTGAIPLEIGNAASLSVLALDRNRLSSNIPPSLWNLCPRLTLLALDSNALDGEIPNPANPGTQCPVLTDLRLQNNQLSGPIPAFLGDFAALTTVDLSNNSFSGAIPTELGQLANLRSFSVAYNNLSGSARARMPNEKQQVGVDFKREFEEEEAGGEAGKIVHFEGGEALTAEDVLNATGEVLGKTSYGTVYKAKLSHGHTIALRLLREGTARDRAEFVPAIQELGLIRHRNLVPLRAYYSGPKEEKLLVYDYMPRGSLADLLHNGSSGKPGASWARRHKIVLGAARGLAHLHTGLSTPVIHGNLKSKNILVDDNYVAHLSDYGLEKLMIPAATNDVITAASTQGYKAPELIKLKRANTKTDIYSFGIVLLEVLTGKRPGKSPESDEVVDLPTMVKAAVLEEKTTDLFDFDLVRGTVRTPSEDGLLQALQLAMGCCAPTPVVRPDIAEVIRQLEEIRPKVLSSVQSPLYTPDSTSTRSREAFDY